MMKAQAQQTIKKARFKKGDQVQVISGKAKGQTGEVVKVDLKRRTVLVKDVNMVKRHTKPRSQDDPGGIVPMESPIAYSNVLPYCDSCGRGVRTLCTKPADCANYKKRK